MAQFGNYEIVREISSSPGVALYLARKPGAKGQFVIKVIRPRERAEIFGAEAATILETEGVAAEHQAEFLEAVRFQKKAADARARNIAPVHDIGSTEDEAWYVTNYYPREALKKLVVCRYSADAADLYHLVSSVVQGLLELKQHCGRTHGRLKVTTILMDGQRGRRLAKTRLLLTDLAPGSAADAAKLELADLRAIGTIVHQVVRRREVRAQDTWIGEGEEWKPLGKLAEGWRALCNKLASPDLTLENYSLEQLQKDARKLKPRLPPLVVGGAALLALLLLGGGAYYYHNISTHASLAIGTEPTGARVLLGQKQISITPYREMIAPGQWTYGLKLDGHYDTNVNVLARAGHSTNVFVRMIPWQGELMVTSKPPGARVVIQPPEGVRIEWLVKTNTTPFIINVPVSKVTGAIEPQLEAKFGNLPKKSKAVVVEKDQRQTVEFVFTRGSVRLDSLPSGAVVLVDGREVGRTPFVDDNVAPGTATYELRLAGYNTDIAQVNVVEDKVTQVKRLMTKGGGTVVVRSDPEGAEVLRLGVVLGRTPFRTKLEAGRQRLVVRHAVLGEQTVDVDVKQDAEIGKEVRFARGSVRLASQPVGAEVLVDGKVVGVTPYENLVVPPGKMITYELRKGTLSEVLQLQVTDGQLVTKDVVLTSGQGVVVVSSDPVGADIFWRSRTGDVPLGKAVAGGLRTKPIEKGMQRLVARHPVLGEQEMTVLVKADAEVATKLAYAYGSVMLTTEPAGVVADVYAGETKLGQTPYRVEMAKAGPVKYRVQAEDYLAQMVEGEVVAGKVNQLVAKLKLAQATLELRSNLPGAEAYLDGKLLGKLPLTQPVDVGTRNLEVRYPGMKSQTRQVKLKKGQTVREEFKFVHGGVVLTTEPTGAEVALGGRVLGTTPYTNLFVDIGDVVFKLTKGTLTRTQTLQVQEGLVTTNHVVLTAPPPTPPPATNVVAMVPPPGKGTLAFTSDPPGAEVFLGGTNSLGVTGANALRVQFDPGLKLFVVRHPVLGEQTASLTVMSDAVVATNIVFAYGGVLVRTEPPVAGAEVFLGNNKMGPAPWSNLVVKVGPVQFEVRATGYETNKVEGTVAARQVRELVTRLKRLPPDVGKPFKNSVGMELEWVADVPDAGKGCWVGKYEVTQEEYEKVMGANPSETKGTRLPVTPVSFNQAMQFCQKLTTNEDRSIRYTLPTEAQWIYLVADAKLEDAVVSKGQPQKREHPEAVGSTGKPNKFGIFDIRGNVWEWCEGPNPQKAVKGGAFDGLQEGGFMGTLGINYRREKDPALPSANVGFRVIVLLTK